MIVRRGDVHAPGQEDLDDDYAPCTECGNRKRVLDLYLTREEGYKCKRVCLAEYLERADNPTLIASGLALAVA